MCVGIETSQRYVVSVGERSESQCGGTRELLDAIEGSGTTTTITITATTSTSTAITYTHARDRKARA